MTNRTRQKRAAVCTISGCDKGHEARGLCPMHYQRWRKEGSAGEPTRRTRPAGSGGIDAYGYVILNNATHPLARAQGKVAEHRAVLYDALGPEPHPCHWCGRVVHWTAARQGERICVDHLDWNRTNNELTNLVVSCLSCNAHRKAVAA